MADPAAELQRVLNEASVEQFTDHYKVAPELAEIIVAHRPYRSELDLLEKAILPKRVCEQLITQIVTAQGSDEAA